MGFKENRKAKSVNISSKSDHDMVLIRWYQCAEVGSISYKKAHGDFGQGTRRSKMTMLTIGLFLQNCLKLLLSVCCQQVDW